MTVMLDAAVTRMLLAFTSKPSPERVTVFLDAIATAGVCHRCAAHAAKVLTAQSKRPPVPRDLVDETRSYLDSVAHHLHLEDRGVLGPGDTHAWWATEAPAIVRKHWPELSGDEAIRVASILGELEYVPPTAEAIAVEVGYVDRAGPTPERMWWQRRHGIGAAPEKLPTQDRKSLAIPVGDR